jgi:CheY-like chemotaxis protein
MTDLDALSVLVVDEEPSILTFLASLLEANGMRALLARSAHEAVGIAQRGYVPIDLILSDIVVKESVADSGISEITGAEMLNRLRQIRPDTRALYMSAYVDSGVIRIQLMNRQSGEDIAKSDHTLIESIRTAASAPLAFRGSAAHSHQ